MSNPTTLPDVRMPLEMGVDSRGILALLDALEADPAIEPHGIIIQRSGARIAEGYWSPRQSIDQRLLYSVSKSFTGTALGLMIGEGKLSLDDLVIDHLPEYFADADPAFDTLTIRHIASMATGHMAETLGFARKACPENIVKGFLQIPPRRAPGKLFAYNQPPVVALATVLQRLAGEPLLDYLRPRLMEPLGMSQVQWADIEPGLCMGYSGLFARLDDVAKLGQLYLDRGEHQGKALLPSSYVDAATALQTPNRMNIEADWRQGYGLQLWQSQHGYRGDGAMGQYMVVLPEQNTVVAFFSLTDSMQRVLDLLWEHLLPALGSSALPDGDSDEALTQRLKALSQPTASERLGLDAFQPEARPIEFLPALDSGEAANQLTPHRTLKRITLEGHLLVLDEGDHTLRLPLSTDWQVIDHVAVSAGSDHLGQIHIDLILRETPHRLELTLNPIDGLFQSHWPLPPLFGAGVGKYLALMKAPD